MTLTHLEWITIPLAKLHPTFNKLTASWKPYLDTWKLVDTGVTTPKETPLYLLMLEHYSRFKKKRLEYERQLLELRRAEADLIAEEWVRRHIELYQSIKQRGYKPELREKPIQVRIRNDGAFSLVDGTHTVSILLHLKHEAVEAKVVERYPQWLDFKQKLYQMYGEKLLYQPVNHPDFDDWRIDRTDSHRIPVIHDLLSSWNGVKVLDVGSNMGQISLALVDLGATVTGIDPNQTRVDFANLLADYHDYPEENPLYLCEGFETHLQSNSYDIALVLSVLHHYLRRGLTEFCEAVEVISGKCDKMILEMGLERMPVKWHPKIVVDNSEYNSYRILYDGLRPIILYEK